jgi:hypothetical protein
MKTLKEFLHEHAEMERGRADERTAIQEEWIGALMRLLQQIKEWLRDADEEHQLEIEERWHKLREINVGVYAAPGLVIRLGAREVEVIPVARMVVGPELSNGLIRVDRAFGRVDLTDGDKSYLLFRTLKEPADEWVIVEDEGYTVDRFDRRTLEEAMQSLLR